MTRLAVWAAVLALAPAARGASPDPKSLAIPEPDLERARALAGRLGDHTFQTREQATRELFRMGRAALPVVERALSTTADPEVKARCEWLLPRAVAADQRARLDTFLADADGKYDHDLPGWNELARVTGNTKAARELFVDMVRVKGNAEVLAGLRDPAGFGRRLAARRVELYNRVFRFSDGRREPPTGPEVAALVLAEAVNPTPAVDRRYQFAAFSAVTQPAVRDYLTAAGKGEAFRKLVAHWFDSRTDAHEQNSAMSAASVLNLKEVPPAALAARVLSRDEPAAGNNPPVAAPTAAYTKAQALSLVAKTGDKSYLPVVKKLFADDAAFVQWRFNNGVNQQVEVKVRDTALAMAVVLTGQDPKAYGFDVQNPAEAAKYYYYNYSFPDPARRKFAFVKWAFREARAGK